MTKWACVKDRAKYGVGKKLLYFALFFFFLQIVFIFIYLLFLNFTAVCNFNEVGSHRLSLTVGETVHILRENQGV